MNFEEKEKRLNDILFIMEYWEELPERLQGKFEGMVTILADFMQEEKKNKNQLNITNKNLSITSNKCPNGVTKNLKGKGEKICSK